MIVVRRHDEVPGQVWRAYEIGTVLNYSQLPYWLEVDDRQLDIIRRLLDLGGGCVVVEYEGLQILTRSELQDHYIIVEE